ncbi:hypothetical protein [Frankia tisae]|nr:hypothetical protein [Frankia tisae]
MRRRGSPPAAPVAGTVLALEIDVTSDESTGKAAAWVTPRFEPVDVP